MLLLTTSRDALLVPLLSMDEIARMDNLRLRRLSDCLLALYSIPLDSESGDGEGSASAGLTARREVLVAVVVCLSRISTGRYGGEYLPVQLKPLACRRPKAREPPLQHMLASLTL